MMNDIIFEIKNQIKNAVSCGIENMCSLIKADENALKAAIETEIEIEIPKEKSHGDFSTNIAMKLTKTLRNSPINIANALIDQIKTEKTYIKKIEIAGPGFINFYLDDAWLYDGLKECKEKKDNYGRLDIGNGKKVMVEFVSANPTGPMHMGNARGGALGDSLAAVLDMAG